MSMYQIAKILEISGFVIAAIFGTILFSKEFFSKWVEYFNSKLASTRDKWNNWYIPILQRLALAKWFKGVWAQLVITSAEICIALGWLIEIKWLFWLGLVVISPFVIFIIPSVTFLRFRNDPRMNSMLQFPKYLVVKFVRMFVSVPILLIPFLIILNFFGIITLSLNVIAKEDFIKKAFIILGSVIVVIGLILETIATW